MDRRASKNRKIRYVVHEKILNFLMPQQNLAALEGKEALVANLFGRKKQADLAQAGRKRGRKDAPVDEIALI